jgi:nucleotide-binding universal stress UspA family protein
MVNRQLVLVAIDHATDMTRAIRVALSVAKARGADVDVIQVMPHRAVRVDDRSHVWSAESYDDGRVNVGARLAAIRRSGDHDGVHVRSVTLRGTPEQVIPAYSQLHQATLLVVQRDYGSPRVWRNSGLVDDLARQSPIPLLVLPTQETRQGDESNLRRILAPVDFSIASAVALRTALDLSRRHAARLTLAHALKDVPEPMVFSSGEGWEMGRRLSMRVESVEDRLRREAAFLGANDVDIEVATGEAGRAILEITSRTDPDLVVMGATHRSWIDRVVFGSTLRRVLRRATVPILVVPVVAGAYVWVDGQGVHRTSIRTEPAAEPVAA